MIAARQLFFRMVSVVCCLMLAACGGGGGGGGGSAPSPVPVSGYSSPALYFFADDGVHGRELWKTDGTDVETVLVKDIEPGSGGLRRWAAMDSAPTVMNGLLYFAADRSTGRELWRTDGTGSGTTLVKSIPYLSFISAPFEIFPYNGALYFTAYDAVVGHELWKSDGTTAETHAITDLVPGIFPAGDSFPHHFAAFNNLLFFTAAGGPGYELWKTDGTTAGTTLVANIAGGSAGGSNPSELTEMAGWLYFKAYSPGYGTELWKTNGSGAVKVKEINAILGDSADPSYLTVFNGQLYFAATDGDNTTGTTIAGRELWKTDGTNAGTVRVKDIYVGVNSSAPAILTSSNGFLYFAATDFTHGRALWKTDGSEAGTVLVKAITPMPDDPLGYPLPGRSAVFNGDLYLTASDGVSGNELWKTDGTEAGTVLVKDIRPGVESSLPLNLTVFNGALYFIADDGVYGRELWKTDGTEGSTIMVKDIYPGSSGSVPDDLIVY